MDYTKSIIKILINNLFLKSFDTIFIKNKKKKIVKKLIFFPQKFSLNELLTNTLRKFISVSLFK